MKRLLFYFATLLFLVSCQQPPQVLSNSEFFNHLKSGQIDKVVVINNEQIEFTIKNTREYPVGKWFLLPSETDIKKFDAELQSAQATFPEEQKIQLQHKTRIAFLSTAFNYLLPIIVLAGLVAAFMALRRNRN